jgi:hypothetical protein
MRSPRSVVAIALAVAGWSCGGAAQPPPAALSSRWTAPPLLAHVPADTPYLLAVLEPASPALRKSLMRSFSRQLGEVMKKADQIKPADLHKAEPWQRVVLALAAELRNRDPDTLPEQLGIDLRGRFVLYGLSVWPVARMEIADPARLRATIDRALASANVRTEQRTLDGQPYWITGDQKASFVAALLDHELVAALLPSAALDAALPLVLGTRTPDRNLSNAPTVPDLIARHRFEGTLLAYFDSHSLVDIIAGAQPTPFDLALRALTGPVSAACHGDLERLAAIVPRIALGYHKFDATGMAASAVFELPPAVLGGLRKLATVVPEVSERTPGHPLFSLGAAIDPVAFVEWMRGVTGELRAHPFACPWFTPLNDAGSEIAHKLDAPLPRALRGMRGGSIVIDDAAMLPPSVTGHVLLAGERVADLVTSLAGAVPAIAGIPLARDGTPIALPVRQLHLPVSAAHLALTTDRLVITAGEDSARRVSGPLTAPLPERSPLAVMTFNMPRFQQLMTAMGQAKIDNVLSFSDVGMALDVDDGGVVLDLWGSWKLDAAPPAPPPPAPVTFQF